MGLSANENCGLCANEKDSIEHMFWNCNITQIFWTQFVDLVKEKCQNAYNLRLSKGLVILGVDDNIRTDPIFDFILLFAKQYVYKCKLERCQPNIDVFKRKLSMRYRIELFNAKLDQTQNNFNTKWCSYRLLCTD